MGYMKHDAIIVTSWEESQIQKAHEKATELLGGLVSPIISGVVNGYQSFFIAPDGSKEGWAESDEYDTLREQFIKYVNSHAYEDGSNCIEYVHVTYDEEGRKTIKGNG